MAVCTSRVRELVVVKMVVSGEVVRSQAEDLLCCGQPWCMQPVQTSKRAQKLQYAKRLAGFQQSHLVSPLLSPHGVSRVFVRTAVGQGNDTSALRPDQSDTDRAKLESEFGLVMNDWSRRSLNRPRCVLKFCVNCDHRVTLTRPQPLPEPVTHHTQTPRLQGHHSLATPLAMDGESSKQDLATALGEAAADEGGCLGGKHCTICLDDEGDVVQHAAAAVMLEPCTCSV